LKEGPEQRFKYGRGGRAGLLETIRQVASLSGAEEEARAAWIAPPGRLRLEMGLVGLLLNPGMISTEFRPIKKPDLLGQA
jgi:hypothetical protein